MSPLVRRTTSATRGLTTVATVATVAVSVAVSALSAHLGLQTVTAWRAVRERRRVPEPPSALRRRYVVCVPAHDEEQLIGATLDSLSQLDYPSSQIAVHVVADNCTDGTAAVAAAHGATVHERHDPAAPGKGPALSWLLDRLQHRGEPYDAVVIVDADTLVSPSFLQAVDARMDAGARVIQGHYAVRDPGRSWLVGVRAATLSARHYLRPLARTSVGGSAGLHGNGMVFAASVIASRSFSGHLTEDAEMEAMLLLGGERVAFAPDAVVRAEMPTRLADARTQNERWERGRLDVARRFVPLLARAAVDPSRSNRLACADAAVDQLMPPLSVLVATTAAAAGASGALLPTARRSTGRLTAALTLVALLVQGGYLASGLRMVAAPASVWRALLASPLYIAWKALLWIRAVPAGASAPWIRTPRTPRPEGAS